MTWLIFGLGNPGARYERTRHNIGHHVVADIADRIGAKFSAHRGKRVDVASGSYAGQSVIIGRSRGYMNDSGGPIKELLTYFGVEPARLIVIHDELDLDLGRLRVKFGGGDNGHNGLKSIRSVLGTGDYLRIRCGIGRPAPAQGVFDYVLKPFAAGERSEAALMAVTAADAVEAFIEKGLPAVQNEFNR